MDTLSNNKIEISITKQLHKKEFVLLLTFKYNNNIINQLRKLKKFTWSKTLHGWASPFSEEILKELEKKLTELAILKIHPPVIKKHTKEG